MIFLVYCAANLIVLHIFVSSVVTTNPRASNILATNTGILDGKEIFYGSIECHVIIICFKVKSLFPPVTPATAKLFFYYFSN